MSVVTLDEARPARSALTKTGGYLAGFTHSLQPYLGCRFGCGYCYVSALPVHRFHRPRAVWGAYVHPRTGIAERLTAELARAERRDQLDHMAVFMSSATDPYQPAERSWRLSRSCLDAFVRRCPALLLVQTRSPFVADDFSRLAKLGQAAWLSMTLETDLDDVRRALAPASPSIERRIRTICEAREYGLQVQIAVSPCLPYSDIDRFGGLLKSLADRVVIDTFTSGDGSSGTRSAHSTVPEVFTAYGWGEWRSEAHARQLYDWLKPAMGERVGWSRTGFVALAQTYVTTASETQNHP